MNVRRVILIIVLLCVAVLTPCVASRSTAATSNPAAAACANPSVLIPWNGGGPLEFHAKSSKAQLWGLLFNSVPLHAGESVKIAWRMTGQGTIHFRASGPGGLRIVPEWGPERHSGSNWNRPGNEWGTGWRFPTAGCWQVHVTRGHSSGNAWLTILPSSSPLLTWLQEWPMPEHDPQRTNRSTATGPTFPQLLFKRTGVRIYAVAPSGQLVGCRAGGGLTALDEDGGHAWSFRSCLPDLTIAPDGTVEAVGWNPPPGRHMYQDSDTAALAFAANGTMRWKIQPFGQLKGAEPLLTPDGRLVVPIVGHATPYDGTNVIAPDGHVTHYPDLRCCALAQAPNGTLYAIGQSALQAFDLQGHLLWHQPISGTASWPYRMLVTRNGDIITGHGQWVRAFTADGHQIWSARVSDRILELAERADGTLLALGSHTLHAFSVAGKQRWRLSIGASGPFSRPSLAVDAANTAFVGTGDGKVAIVSPSGLVLARLDAGGRRPAAAPLVLLTASGKLIVSGTDNVVRVYGS